MRRNLPFLALAAFLALAGPALASSCTVTTSAAVCVAAKTTNGGYRSVVIDNEGTAAICVTDDGSTPVCGAAGTYTIGPGTSRTWSANNVVFIGPFTAISASGSQPVTYTAN